LANDGETLATRSCSLRAQTNFQSIMGTRVQPRVLHVSISLIILLQILKIREQTSRKQAEFSGFFGVGLFINPPHEIWKTLLLYNGFFISSKKAEICAVANTRKLENIMVELQVLTYALAK
jgi:hypothetical protein